MSAPLTNSEKLLEQAVRAKVHQEERKKEREEIEKIPGVLGELLLKKHDGVSTASQDTLSDILLMNAIKAEDRESYRELVFQKPAKMNRKQKQAHKRGILKYEENERKKKDRRKKNKSARKARRINRKK